jgi:hypothetical protein
MGMLACLDGIGAGEGEVVYERDGPDWRPVRDREEEELGKADGGPC